MGKQALQEPCISFLSSKCGKIARLATQYPIKVIKQSKRKKEKENHTFFLNSFSVDQIDVFLSQFQSCQCYDEKTKNTTKKIIRHLLFDNFTCLTCPDNVSLVNSLIFSSERRWFNRQNREEKNNQKSGKNRCPYPAFFYFSLNIRRASFLKYLLYTL